MLENLLKLLESGQDTALLRFGIGSAYLKQKEFARAEEHLARAVQMDPTHSAAWKLYGNALQQLGKKAHAREAFGRGIEIAAEKGDLQAVKEMRVFLKRLG